MPPPTMPLLAPEWLVLHEGALKPGVEPETRVVTIGGRPLYKLEVRPAEGKYACTVTSTINGRRLDDAAAIYPDPGAALTGGLERLRTALGW